MGKHLPVSEDENPVLINVTPKLATRHHLITETIDHTIPLYHCWEGMMSLVPVSDREYPSGALAVGITGVPVV